MDFLSLVREKLKLVEMDESFLKRSVDDEGFFRWGEEASRRVLQMAVLRPRLAVLDEDGFGLDIDARE